MKLSPKFYVKFLQLFKRNDSIPLQKRISDNKYRY